MTERSHSGATRGPGSESEQDSLIGAPRGASNDSSNSGETPESTFGAGVATDSGGGEGAQRRKRRRGGAGRRTKPRANAPEAADPAEAAEAPKDERPPRGEAQADESKSQQEGAPRKRRRRRKRSSSAETSEGVEAGPQAGGRSDEEDSPAPESGSDDAAEASDGEPRRRRRRSRRGRGGRSRKVVADGDETAGDATDENDDEGREPEAAAAPARKRKRSRRRKSGGGSGADSSPEAEAPVGVDAIPGEDDELGGESLEGEPQKESRRGGRSRGGAKRKPAEDKAPAKRAPGPKNVILVNAADREETRVAVVEGDEIHDFQMTVKSHRSMVNDIYRGRVVNLEPAIGAAFIDFGQGRNGFLHTSDVLSAYGEDDWKLENLLTTQIDPEEWDEESSQPDIGAEVEAGEDSEGDDESQEGAKKPAKGRGRGRKERGRGAQRSRARPRLPISDLLKKGDSVVVQVTKDAIGDKGPTLTTYISIPGRYLVLMPSMTRTGVSRKIDDDKERRRLKKILESLHVPAGMGVIVRTAGVGCTKADIKRDLDYLLLLWESFGKRLTLGRGPVPLYEESDVAIRTIRDLFTDDTEAVVVDDERVHKRVLEFVEKLMPENLDRIQLHDGPRPLLHTYGVEQDFERMFARRIDLPSGGSIVMDQTEALVAIDVNSGKTRSDGFDFEDIALKTNLDAVPEIARQIRLRDLGGIIVCDFIDMMKMAHRRQVERALRDALAGDRARSKLGRISQFGLLEMTRQRLGPGLAKMLFQNCQHCRGSGRLRTIESRGEAIIRRLGSALTLKGFTKVEVRAAPEVIAHLRSTYTRQLDELAERHNRELAFTEAPEQVEDSVLRYLRADGREVRPGGRRKR